MKTAIILLSLIILTAEAPAQTSGQAIVIDGGTVEIHGARIRIWGIDALESAQTCQTAAQERYRCGEQAASELRAFIARRPVTCVEVDRDRYKRAVAVCTVDGVELARWLVQNGYAIDRPRYSLGNYSLAQSEAKRARKGVWAGSFVEPWRYRECVEANGHPLNCSDD